MAERTPKDGRSGTTLRSSGFEEETRGFLQRRLRLQVGVLAVLTFIFIVAILSTLIAEGNPVARTLKDFVTKFPGSLVTGEFVFMTGLFVLLSASRISARGLAIADGLAYLGILALPTIPYVYLEDLFQAIPALLLFIMMRAIFVPSTARYTALLSAPATVVVLLVDLSRGFDDLFVILNQILLIGGIFVAAMASHVNIGLRRRTYEAKHLGQYELEERIGEGAMGEVYRATHSVLKRPTAVKFLRPEIAGAQTLARFELEVRQTCRLSHPNTISIYDFGHTAEGVFYHAMELVDGETLAEIVERDGPLQPERVVDVLSQACGALAEAHDMGIVHRDLKAANIMLCRQGGEDGVVKVLDFGLVKDLEGTDPTASMQGQLIGTPETMAPEVIRGETASPASDLYSLCAVGYLLATGKRIFDATAAAEFLALHLSSEPVPLTKRDPAIPAGLEKVILRGLAKDPGERFSSAREMKAELARCG